MKGEKVGSVSLGRGLREGDSLSLYLFILCAKRLFILCAKRLASLMKRANVKLTFMVLRCVEGPQSSHTFLFADDCFLFTEPLRENVTQSRMFSPFMNKSQRKLKISRNLKFFSVEIPLRR